MLLLKNNYLVLLFVAVLAGGAALCGSTVAWIGVFLILIPALLGQALRRLLEDDYSDEFEDADWRKN